MGVSRDCPNFWSTPIISGTGKATNLNFCTHILSIVRNKTPLQLSGKVAGCIVRALNTFQSTHILGASRGILCDSSAVLLSYDMTLSGTVRVLAMGETFHPLMRQQNWRELAVQLVGNDRQRLLSDSLYPI